MLQEQFGDCALRISESQLTISSDTNSCLRKLPTREV